jgi:hypothetical protein
MFVLAITFIFAFAFTNKGETFASTGYPIIKNDRLSES